MNPDYPLYYFLIKTLRNIHCFYYSVLNVSVLKCVSQLASL